MPHLDERQRRVVAGTTASVPGRGGLISVSEATGISRSTLGDAIAEVQAGVEPPTRGRRPRAGRKKLVDPNPPPLPALHNLSQPPPTPSARPTPSACTTSAPTKVSWWWATTMTPPPSPFPPSAGGGTWSDRRPTLRPPSC